MSRMITSIPANRFQRVMVSRCFREISKGLSSLWTLRNVSGMSRPIRSHPIMKTKHTVIAASLLALLASPSLRAEDGARQPEKNGAEVAKKNEVKPYPLDTCIVSDEKLGEMGKPVVFVYKGQEIKLCCKHCRKDFDKDPAKYLKKLKKAK